MEDMLSEIEHTYSEVSGTVSLAVSKAAGTDAGMDAEALGALLQEYNGQDVSVLDLRGMADWTDFFIIATVTSKIHMDGLERHIKEFCREKEITILGKSRKTEDDEWRLIDLGSCIVHLMNKNARDFYDLERLWTPIKHPQGVDEKS